MHLVGQLGAYWCPLRLQHAVSARRHSAQATSVTGRKRRRCTCSVQESSEASTTTSQADGDLQLPLELQSAPKPPPGTVSLKLEVVNAIHKVDKEQWNACAIGAGVVNPFLLWEFFHCLEESGSASSHQGWLAQHVLLWEPVGGQLMGCVPLYLKTHSYGEYVFDHSWANVYARMGKQYYPKLQSCVPFTPVPGNRLLLRPGPQQTAVRQALTEALKELTGNFGVSGLHLTFNDQEEWAEMSRQGFLQRTGLQYHWQNNGYETFEDFLADLKQPKRKAIRQERKSIEKQGYQAYRLNGTELSRKHWDQFYMFYRNTTDKKWGQAYLNRKFFHLLGETMPERVVMAVAADGKPQGQVVAAALNLQGSHALFGRNWGCDNSLLIKNLHFELCYYQAIEAAIEVGLERVEAGAQGEHKIQRGYLPSPTYSSHYMTDPEASHVIENFLHRERMQIAYAIEACKAEDSPYRDPPVEPEIDPLVAATIAAATFRMTPLSF